MNGIGKAQHSENPEIIGTGILLILSKSNEYHLPVNYALLYGSGQTL